MADPARRRLAAMLCGDVVGYSRLMAADAEATVAALRDSRERIARCVAARSGRLVDFTGDAFLAEFPSALDAARCALEITSALEERDAGLPEERHMRFRLGVHLGDVIQEQERIYGDGINVAARLQELAGEGGVCVSGPVYEQVRRSLGAGFEDLGERRVKNIPHRVRAYRVLPGARAVTRRRRAALPRLALAAASLLALAALAVVLSWPRPLGLVLDWAGVAALPAAPALPDKPSIAVLPFTNLSGDPVQEYFSDGMTDDLITDLSKIPELFVIARHSAFAYKGKNRDLKEVGRELGVRYVLEGSVQRSDAQVRINAQLIDAQTGFHLWSERYDGELADVFAVQEEISRAILESLRVALREAELDRLVVRRTRNLEAYDAALRGVSHFHAMTRADVAEARRLFARAIELDPDYAEAIAYLGTTYTFEYAMGWNRDPELITRAHALAERALTLDPRVPVAHALEANVRVFEQRPAQAIASAERAVELAPSLDPPHFILGMTLVFAGRPVAALEHVKTALRINPRGPPTYRTLLGLLNLLAGRVDEAVRLCEEVRAENADMLHARILLAVVYAEERPQEARRVVREILRVNPELTAATAVGLYPGRLAQSRREAWKRALRAAGMP